MGHVLAALGELERTGARSIEVRRDAAEAFDRELRAALAGTVWHTRLHELVHRRERQRPQPVAVAVERLPPADRAHRPRRLRAHARGCSMNHSTKSQQRPSPSKRITNRFEKRRPLE